MKLPALSMGTVRGITCAALWIFPAIALAQTFPGRPISVIYPFPPGNPGENKLRAMYAEASKTLGTPVISEYRPGAGGRLGVVAVQKSPPDGTLLTFATDTVLSVVPHASASFKAQADRDYAPVHLTFGLPLILASHPKLPFRDVRGWVEYARTNPGKVTYASQGIGGTSHLNMEKIMAALDISMTHVPYGATQFQPDLLSGVVDMMVFSLTVLAQPIRDGRLIGLAMPTTRRSPQVPNVPTMREAGFDVVIGNWNGIVAAPGTPAEIVNRINMAFNAAQKLPEVAKIFALDESEMFMVSAQAFSAHIKSEYDKNAAVVQRLGLEFD